MRARVLVSRPDYATPTPLIDLTHWAPLSETAPLVGAEWDRVALVESTFVVYSHPSFLSWKRSEESESGRGGGAPLTVLLVRDRHYSRKITRVNP